MSGTIQKRVIAALLIVVMCMGLTNCANGNNVSTPTLTPTPEATATPIPEDIYEGILKKAVGAGVCVHDPSIYQAEDGTYYIYGSHMANAKGTTLRTWKYCGNGYNSNNAMFVDLFSDDIGIFDYAGDNGGGNYSVWAPHVFYNKAMGKYCMYMCTSSTYIWSSLCFATSDSPEGPFEWQANLLYSGFTKNDLDKTDVVSVVGEDYAYDTYFKSNGAYNNALWPNCIDPTVFYDEDGRLWMVYGSWSGGMFLLELDEKTGLIIHPETDEENGVDKYFGRRLLGGGHVSIEGPYIQYNPDNGYYYLFVSYGGLQRDGGYQMRVYRAEDVEGPYLDMNGDRPLMTAVHYRYGLKLSGNYRLPSLTTAYMATGGQSSIINNEGKYFLCFHTRFETNGEYHEPRVHQYFFNEEGWPVMAPYLYREETISTTGYDESMLIGTYYFINQGTAINAKIAEPQLIELKAGGVVDGENVKGTWSYKEGTCYMTLTYNDVTYSGVFIKMKDQASTDVMAFTAAGANESIWGVHYLPAAE